jgi:hypothetical protein
MREALYVLGSTAMLAGVALVVTAVLMSMRRRGLRGRELLLLLGAGVILIVVGRWAIQ